MFTLYRKAPFFWLFLLWMFLSLFVLICPQDRCHWTWNTFRAASFMACTLTLARCCSPPLDRPSLILLNTAESYRPTFLILISRSGCLFIVQYHRISHFRLCCETYSPLLVSLDTHSASGRCPSRWVIFLFFFCFILLLRAAILKFRPRIQLLCYASSSFGFRFLTFTCSASWGESHVSQ